MYFKKYFKKSLFSSAILFVSGISLSFFSLFVVGKFIYLLYSISYFGYFSNPGFIGFISILSVHAILLLIFTVRMRRYRFLSLGIIGAEKIVLAIIMLPTLLLTIYSGTFLGIVTYSELSINQYWFGENLEHRVWFFLISSINVLSIMFAIVVIRHYKIKEVKI